MKLQSSLVKLLLILLFPLITWARSSPDTSSQSNGIAKSEWLEQVRNAVSVPVCKSFMEDDSIGAQMKSRHINYDQCIAAMPAVTSTCIQKYDASIPATLSDDDADKWGKVIGGCIGKEFATGYLYANPNDKSVSR